MRLARLELGGIRGPVSKLRLRETESSPSEQVSLAQIEHLSGILAIFSRLEEGAQHLLSIRVGKADFTLYLGQLYALGPQQSAASSRNQTKVP